MTRVNVVPVQWLSDLWYTVTDADIALNCQRLLERYRENPTLHKWTNRTKPEWLKEEKQDENTRSEHTDR